MTEVVPGRRVPPIPLKLRMLLALRLASTLLQILHTQWLKSAWSKDVVCFPLFRAECTNAAKIDFSKPFISSGFNSETSGNLAPIDPIEPKIAMLELGIMLLEIWHETTLETQFSLRESPTKYHKRLALALTWRDEAEVVNPLLELYDKAMSYCLTGVISGEARNTQWHDLKLWTAVCADIIEPLSKNCKLWK